MPLLGPDAVAIDRLDGLDLLDTANVTKALRGCEAIVHLAALHPLIAPLDADAEAYRQANVTPLVALLAMARSLGIQRLVLASSTSVGSDERVRRVDEAVDAVLTGPSAAHKR